MSDITKKVSRHIPPTERVQTFTQADAGAGDVLMIEDSLGHPAHRVSVEADAIMTFRTNVYQDLYPWVPNDQLSGWGEDRLHLASGIRIQTDETGIFSLAASETLELDDDISVRDLELVTVSGNFTVTVM